MSGDFDDLNGADGGLLPLPVLSAEEAMREVLGEAEANKHSARYIRERNPRMYAAVLLLRGYGVPVERIAIGLKIGENTVRAIEFEGIATVEDCKKEIMTSLRRVVQGGWALLADNLEKVDIDKLPILMGIATDKMLLMDGQATARVEHTGGVTVLDIAARIEALKAAQMKDVTTVDGDVVLAAEIPVLGGDGDLQQGGGLGLGVGADDATEELAGGEEFGGDVEELSQGDVEDLEG